MKRITMLLSLLLTARAFAALPDGGPYTETVDGIEWTYEIKKSKALVGSSDGKPAISLDTIGEISIPTRLGGCEVTSVGAEAFWHHAGLTSVIIPDTVSYIDWNAFHDCTNLRFVKMSQNIIGIGHGAFGGCSSLGEGLVMVDGCLLTINTNDGNYPNKIELPTNVRLIADTVLAVPGVKSIEVAPDNKYFHSSDGILFNKTHDSILAYPTDRIGDYEIPAGITRIGNAAFYGCAGLTAVKIPSGVTSIGEHAFAHCDSLKTVVIPMGVSSIEYTVFASCTELTSVAIPSSVKTIVHRAFRGCSSLKTVYVNKGDTNRIRQLLESAEFSTDNLTFVESDDSMPESVDGFTTTHSFNGLATDEFGMCGMIQVATTKKSKKGDVKVSGFVMLEDGKKQTLKSATGTVSGGAVSVTTKVGKLGELALTITDDGFTGTLGDMTVASSEVGEETGIISGTLKMSYFDAKTDNIKTKSITIKGLTDGNAAEGSATVKGKSDKLFTAEISE